MAKRKAVEPKIKTQPRRSDALAWLLVFAAVLFIAIIRIRLLQIPLERDEGEYAYSGQLILQGIAPYKLAYNMKFPGVYGAYALIMAVFGQTIGGIHFGLLLVNAVSMILIFLLARRLFDSFVGVAAAAGYGILSLSPAVLGFAGHATQFVVLPAIGGLLLLLKANFSRRLPTYFWSGLLFGIALVMKQQGAAFAVFGGLWILWSILRVRPIDWKGLVARAGVYTLGVIVPFILTCAILYKAGVFEKFWFWTIQYAREYASEQPLSMGIRTLGVMLGMVAGPHILLWGLAAIGLVVVVLDKAKRSSAYFMLGFAVFSFLAVSPGLYFRNHYFVLMLPAVAVLTGVAAGSVRLLIDRRHHPVLRYAVPVLVMVIALGYSVVREQDYLFTMSPQQVSRGVYGQNPFPESIEIAKYIRKHTNADDKIAVIGSEPQIYFYSDRHSATGYIYTYGLMEKQSYAPRMQDEMIREIESAHPRYLVLVMIPTSWLARKESDLHILKWFDAYSRKNYDVAGVIDLSDPEWTNYQWDKEVAGLNVTSQLTVLVFRAKS